MSAEKKYGQAEACNSRSSKPSKGDLIGTVELIPDWVARTL